MVIERVFIYPLFDFQSYSKYKVKATKEVIMNLKDAGVTDIVLVHNLVNELEDCTYEPVINELSNYNITILTSTEVPQYLLNLKPNIVDTRVIPKSYNLYLETERPTIDDTICCALLDDIDSILEPNNNKITVDDAPFGLLDSLYDEKDTSEPLIDLDNFDMDSALEEESIVHQEIIPDTYERAYSSTELLLAMVNAKKKNKTSNNKIKKTKPKKIMTLLEYTTKEIESYLLNVKMIINTNSNAICLNYLNSYLPKNILKLTVDSTACNLKLGTNKLKLSYINMKGVH